MGLCGVLDGVATGGTSAVFKVAITSDVGANVSQMRILSVRISMSVRMSMEFECVVV